MKTATALSLVLGLYLAAPQGAQAAIQCEITYASNGDKMEWLFDSATDTTAFAEIAYRKNGGSVVSHSADKYPLWTITINEATNVVGLSSRVDPGYVLAYFINPSPNVGGASMFSGKNKIGSGVCAKADPPATEYARPTPPPPASGDDAVSFTFRSDGMHVSATVAGHSVDMLVDTGANRCTVNESLADTLIADGQATELELGQAQLADGSWHSVRRISIKSLGVGSHWRTDVPFMVNPDASTPLLGLPVLLVNGNGKFTVDAVNQRIIFG
jgi:hypothetical protein